MGMNMRSILLIGGVIIVTTLLVGVIWGWAAGLACLIGGFLITLLVYIRMALLRFYLRSYSLRTILYTNPISAILYSFVDPHRRSQSQESDDLNALFPTQKIQEQDELPQFHFTETADEENGENNKPGRPL